MMHTVRPSGFHIRSKIGSRSTAALLAAAASVTVFASASPAGTLYSFGLNQFGQIGDGTSGGGTTGNNSPTTPTPVVGLTSGITAFSISSHSLAVKDGALYSWGWNGSGQLGQGTGGSGATSEFNTLPAPALVLTSGVTRVAGGSLFSVAVANGAVYTFGQNSNGALGTNAAAGAIVSTPTLVPTLASGVTAIATSQQHALAIQNGALFGWGNNNLGQLGIGVYSTGANRSVPVPIGNGMESGVTGVSAGTNHSLAIKNGAVYSWGYNQYGQLGNGGPTAGTAALFLTPVANPTLTTNVSEVSAGSSHSMALVNGQVYVWGRNESGQLGQGTATNSLVPITVPGLPTTITDIEAGNLSSYALDVDGSLWTWGGNTYGQLGIGTLDTPLRTPQHVFAPTGYRFTDLDAAPPASTVFAVVSALPVYFTGATGNGLGDVANYATTVAGTTAAPIAPVDSTDIYFGTTNATVANLSATAGAGLAANSLTFGTGVSSTNAVTIGGGPITLNADKNSYAAGTGIVVQSGSAAVTIDAPIVAARTQSWTNNSASTLTVNGGVTVSRGTLTLAGTGNTSLTGAISGSGGLAKSGAGAASLSGSNTYTGTTTVTGGTLTVNAGAATPLLAGAGTTGGTDIQNGTVAFTGGSAASIRGLLAAGFTDAATPGVMDSGTLRSSIATAVRGLGYKDTGTSVIVKAALFGDADLDGGVSINDFNTLAGNFGTSAGKVWVDGDFDYDGGVSINDFNLLAGGFGQSVPPSSEAWSGLLAFAAANNDLVAFEAVTGVPEPTTFGLIAAGATLGLRRRRR